MGSNNKKQQLRLNKKQISLISSCLISMLTYAQEPLETFVKLATQEINIDGFGNEKDWETADEISGFWQWFPTDSLRAEQSTTAKFLVDDINLYILITSYSESSDYIIPSLRRDYSGAGNDNVTVILDTFMDGTNGFMFGTNPLGVKRESLISNGGNNFERDFNKSWDVKWETEATQQDGKTVSEIKIPLKSIQYPEGSSAVCIFKKPRRKLLFILPLSRTPAMILFSKVVPVVSFATPILLEKKGCASLRSPKFTNKSLF